MVRVSVIVPNYNHAAYLKQRIDSILNQTYMDIEVIILDDYSTDSSAEIIEHFRSHSKVSQVIYNKENSGSTFKQWRKGVALAKGDFIWIAESDDFAHPTFLETLIAKFSEPRVGLAYVDSVIVNERGEESGRYSKDVNQWFSSSKWSNDYSVDGLEELETGLLTTCTINNVSAVLFRTETLREVINRIDQLKYAGDWLAYMLICLNGKIAFCAEALNYYRSHSANATKQSASNYKSYIDRYYARLLFTHRCRQIIKHDKRQQLTRIYRLASDFLLKEMRPIVSATLRGRLPMKVLFNAIGAYVNLLWLNRTRSKIYA